MIKILKLTGYVILSIIILIVIIASLFINLSPQFGRSATEEQKLSYESSGHFEDDVFVNNRHVSFDFEILPLLKEQFKDAPGRTPGKEIKVEKIDSLNVVNYHVDSTRITWFGHSAFLLEIDGKKILLDPMLSDVPAPHPWLGPSRYSSALPLEINKIPQVDAVIISHDHYDHLDYETIQKLKDKTERFYTSLGVGNHLVSWGVEAEKIQELNWWDSTTFDGIKLISTPARHFSGRGLFDRQSTLWCSWVIQGSRDNLYFSGDGGYDRHFKEIGDKYGPFDIAMMECGQYNEWWKDIHMMPEETVQASLDLQAKVLLPIHWGAFTLALHDWTDPIERVTKAAYDKNQLITTPKIGEPVSVGSSLFPQTPWWKAYQ